MLSVSGKLHVLTMKMIPADHLVLITYELYLLHMCRGEMVSFSD